MSDQQSYNHRHRKKDRLNDQLIPKPTDINMAEKIIKISNPKEHPYSSHISKFAVFPSFRSPDDPETGVRASSQPFPNCLIPSSAPAVTLLSKTIGGPYRHELLESPMGNWKKPSGWAGEDVLWEHPKPLKGEKNQVFYPAPPKMILPNPKLRSWDLTLSERTSNMLKNLEKSHWITSYQLHYTGSGPANPLMIDDFRERMTELTGMNSHSAPLREKSIPVFVPSKPREGHGRRHGSCAGRRTCSPAAPELLNPSLAPNQGIATATAIHREPQEITAKHNEAKDANQKEHSISKYSSVPTEAHGWEKPKDVKHKQQNESKSFAYESMERENDKVQFNESVVELSVSQSSQETNAAQMAGAQRPLDMSSRPLPQREMEASGQKRMTELCLKDEPSHKKEYFKAGRNISGLSQLEGAADLAGIESHSELLSRAASEQEKLAKGRELQSSFSNPGILPRPLVLPGIRPVDRGGTVDREGAAHSLLDLQNLFSKSVAHRNFNSSITQAAVNLRDNVVTGKKHDFYGVNCFYLHG